MNGVVRRVHIEDDMGDFKVNYLSGLLTQVFNVQLMPDCLHDVGYLSQRVLGPEQVSHVRR